MNPIIYIQKELQIEGLMETQKLRHEVQNLNSLRISLKSTLLS